MSDQAELRDHLLARYPEPWVRQHLDSFQSPYFETFCNEDISRHLELISGLTDAQPVAVRVRREGPGDWWVEVVGFDAFQFLSTLCSLFALRGLSIVEGNVFTSRPPPREPSPKQAPGRRRRRPSEQPRRSLSVSGPDRRKKIVDALRVRQVNEGADEPDWSAFEAELIELTRLLRDNRYDQVHHRLIGRFVSALERYRPEVENLQPLELEIDAGGSELATVVRVDAQDHFGFLSLTASALALCGIMIVQAEIRTQAGRADDMLWVTDRWGKKITAASKLRELRLSLILIEHFSSYLPHATNPESALVHFSRFAGETMAREDWADEFAALDRSDVLDALVRVLGESDFLWEDYLHAQPEFLLPIVCQPSEWDRTPGRRELERELGEILAQTSTMSERGLAIRRFRDREIFRSGVRAILGRNGGTESLATELSEIAEVLLRAAFDIAARELTISPPLYADGRPAAATLCALGKCGGHELGFGSDLELMLVYDDRAVEVASGSVGAHFDRFVSVLRTVLSARRGATFEVDFRLRPYGKSGAPATSVSSFAHYYRAGGPAWGYERQALIKLRAIGGDAGLGREVEMLRDQFVFGPEPFDLEGCLRMRRLQVEQLVTRGSANAKYSPGGLVEIEYFVQALQIAHGAEDVAVRTPSTVDAMTALADHGWLIAEDAGKLHQAYNFLRSLIDALRVVRGYSKDLTIPRFGSEEFVLLARRMKRTEPSELGETVNRTMGLVSSHWNSLESMLSETRVNVQKSSRTKQGPFPPDPASE